MKHTAHGYWLEEAGGVAPMPELVGERRADVVVIGGGYTGMWAAWQIKVLEPEARVVLLEAETCGRGPSGRNGGFCNVMWFSLPNMRQRWGDEGALAVARAARQAVVGIESFCREQEVDAWFRRGGYLQVSTAAAHDGVWEEALAACQELGEAGAIEPLGAAEVAARCASPAFRGGALYPDAATVQPARLAHGLRERLLAAGVEIHERSPVRRLAGASDFDPTGVGLMSDARERGEVTAHTDYGSVRAGAAIVAIGGAAKAPGAPLRDALTVSSSHIVLTEPVPDLLEEIGWTGGECITDSRALIDYFRTTPDGRIAFGWGGGRIAMGARLHGTAELDTEVVAAAAARLREYFPGLAGRQLTHAWGGPVDVSPTHLPLVAPLRGGRAFAAAGYTGNGVGPSYMVGQVLASLALDRRDEHSRLPIVDPSPQRVPPEPFHWLGGATIRRALVSKENAELADHAPSSISSLISRIPQLVGFHIGR
ncbi:MAG TPA: FAD-dependent oxidoreductase [Solirubrobacterales bacterium]|nr:FAD-dependent oxidoreductase [Solirubrobacterales bacterium]